MERRLAAILAADVVGYSRLIGADEAGTLTALRALRKELVEPALKRHHGRVVKLMGDGLLAEFASVVDAVAAAVEIQEATPDRSAHLPEDQRIALRIGVNIGDVAVEDGDLFGDGVNVAARLQEIADPNGVAISEGAYRELLGRLDLPFEDVGEKALKNIKRPVRTWLWSPTNTFDDAPLSDTQLALPDKPSIAVLPFNNLSGDPDQEYFADGMTEDIITGLSRFRSLFVIARNSTFAYKGKSPDVREVARDLGVRYILEGSVRRGGERIRITGQLIDAGTGNHLWAERYDRELEDIFAVQDEVTEAIVAAIAPEIGDVERERVQRKPPDSLDAWGLYQQGLTAYYTTTEEGLTEAIDLFNKVTELDPSFAPAYSMAADSQTRFLLYFQPEDRNAVLKQAKEKADRGITLDRKDPVCLWAGGRVHSLLGQHELAVSQIQDAVALNPNSSMAHHTLGFVLHFAGRPEEALDQIDQAMRLSPHDIFMAGFMTMRAIILFDLERNEECVEWARRSIRHPNPRQWAFAVLVAALTKLGREDAARAELDDLLARAPHNSLSFWRELTSSWRDESRSRLLDALCEAGMPEKSRSTSP